VVEWVYQNAVELHVNRNHIAVSGDSAGGNLATTVSMLDRDLGTNMIKFQALIYPVVDLAHIENEEYTWSVDQYKINKHHDIIMKGFRMRDSSDFLANAYLMGQTEILHPYVSPLFADDLSGLPEALIITAEFDTLRPEAEAYTKKLQKFGVSSQLIQYNGMDHGFIDKIGLYPQAEDCMSEIVKGMKAACKLVD
jgi:acetyl esterase